MTYLMESELESDRLRIKEDVMPSRERLRATGLSTGATVLDAGCGPGAVIPAILDLVGSTGKVVGLDVSEHRLMEAQQNFSNIPNVSFVQASLENTGLASDSFDYTWSQFVFEYVNSPIKALSEMVRVTKPGGKVVVAEIDGLGLANWPQPEIVHRGLIKLQEGLSSAGLDIYIGRKLFSLFRQQGLQHPKVHLFPLYVAAGSAGEGLIADWDMRFKALLQIGSSALGSQESYKSFCHAYLNLLRDKDSLKYSVVLVTEGIKE